MGRTLPTVNQVLEQNREQWSRFYRALRKEDKELLDRLFDGAKYFTAACVYQAHTTPSESILLAMLLHLEKELQALQGRLEGTRDADPAMSEHVELAGDNRSHAKLSSSNRPAPPRLLPAGKEL